MRVVVAGADGYIGSRVCRRLLSMGGIGVLALSRRVSGSEAIAPVDLVKAPDALVSMLTDYRPDAVINCVGTTSPHLRACVDAHVVATANLLAAVAEAAPGARLIQLGSAAEYGQAVEPPLRLNEDTPPVPRGAYAVSKLSSTLLAVTHGPTLGLECVALRVFNLIGPDMTPGTIIPNVMRILANPERRVADPVELGRMDVYRDFVHIDDVVSAIISAVLVGSICSGTIINIASGEAVMIRELVRRLLDAAGHQGAIREVAAGTGRSVGVTWQCADIGRARSLLGWSPRKSLPDSIAELVRSDGRVF
jgi:nucleoside-diphosphate-sugar epimerase